MGINHQVIPQIPQLISWAEIGHVHNTPGNWKYRFLSRDYQWQAGKAQEDQPPKAISFDYLILKDAFGIDIETEILEV